MPEEGRGGRVWFCRASPVLCLTTTLVLYLQTRVVELLLLLFFVAVAAATVAAASNHS